MPSTLLQVHGCTLGSRPRSPGTWNLEKYSDCLCGSDVTDRTILVYPLNRCILHPPCRKGYVHWAPGLLSLFSQSRRCRPSHSHFRETPQCLSGLHLCEPVQDPSLVAGDQCSPGGSAYALTEEKEEEAEEKCTSVKMEFLALHRGWGGRLTSHSIVHILPAHTIAGNRYPP